MSKRMIGEIEADVPYSKFEWATRVRQVDKRMREAIESKTRRVNISHCHLLALLSVLLADEKFLV